MTAPRPVPGAADPDLVRAAAVLAAVREARPLVHCVTATVSMGIVADGLLAAGARPMMTETAAEAPVVTAIADALTINLGTLSTDAMEGIPPTVAAAVRDGRPWVLDPTAIGIAPVRTPLARQLLDSRPTVVRGNASEILALTGAGQGGRGPDSTAELADGSGSGSGRGRGGGSGSGSGEAIEIAAREVAARTGGAVAVSGAVDLVVEAERTTPVVPGAWVERAAPVARIAQAPHVAQVARAARVARGSALLPRVTGTGCLLGALAAACAAAHPDPFEAALAATVWLDLAGELAAERAAGPGSFRMHLLDALDEVGR